MAATKAPSAQAIDAYLDAVKDPAARRTLRSIRAQLRKLLPGATEAISYQMPTFKVDGRPVLAFAYFGRKCGVYPFSGSVIPALEKELAGYVTSKSGVSFPPDEPLPPKLVKAIVEARLAELAATPGKKKAPAKTSLITDRVTDGAVKEATGRDWSGWMKALDKRGARELTHKELVARLGEDGVASSWWQQSIAVAYEQARGKRVVGETAGTGFQVGVQRTVPMTAKQAWALVSEQPERWLGKGATLELEPGQSYELPKRRGVPGVRGVVRVVKPGQRVRLTWHPDGWKKPATLQLTVLPKPKSVALHVHMEKLPDATARAAMRDHWTRVLETLAKP